MKKALLLIITFALTNIVIGQTFVITNNPTFDSVKVVPNNPTSNDSINILVYRTNEADVRCLFPSTFEIYQDTIKIFGNSIQLCDLNIDSYIDTLLIGILNLESYKILLVNRLTTVWGGPESNSTNFMDSVLLNLQINLSISDRQIKENFFTLYPNPTTGKIKINAENIKNVLVINEIGETVLNLEKTNEIDLTNFPKGIYLIKVHTDKFVQVKKIIIH